MTSLVQKKLKVFSDFSILNADQQPVAMLLPFYREKIRTGINDSSDRYDIYSKVGSNFFDFVPVEQSDIAVFPIPWEVALLNKKKMELFEIFYDKVQDYGVPIIIFFWSDSDHPIPIKNTIIFRTSLNRSTRKRNEYAFPSWGEDIIGNYFSGNQQLRIKEKQATVGFTGVAPEYSIIRDIYNRIKPVFRLKKPNEGSYTTVRSESLKVLSKSNLIKNNFILREQFWGTHTDLLKRQKEKEEFVANMINSDYILCARGGGNFSYRFYETLSCGRIPLFIDTDCVLPFDFEIDYKQYCVWVDHNELPNADKILYNFHENISKEDFVSLQQKCRRLWEDCLSPKGFFANIHKHFTLNLE